jgi:hypothetical protein
LAELLLRADAGDLLAYFVREQLAFGRAARSGERDDEVVTALSVCELDATYVVLLAGCAWDFGDLAVLDVGAGCDLEAARSEAEPALGRLQAEKVVLLCGWG